MILEIQGLRFSYGSVGVLQDITFSLGEGEVLAVLGPNGSGKTTLLKCLNRVLVPKGGTVYIDGRETKGLGRKELAQHFGLVPQGAKGSRAKVYDLVLLGRMPHFGWAPGPLDHQKVGEVIRLMGLEHLALRWADELSGGELQLVNLARTLAQDPRVILLDEPTNNLDISKQHRLLKQVLPLVRRKSKGAVMSTHDLNLALRYCDSFILLKDGRIHAAGGKEVITSEVICEVYGMEVQVVPAAGQVLVVPS